MLCYLLFYTMKKLNVEKKGSLVVVKNFSVTFWNLPLAPLCLSSGVSVTHLMPPVRALCGPRGMVGRHSEIIHYLPALLSMCLSSCQSAWLLGSQYVWMLLCLFSLSTYIPAWLPANRTNLPARLSTWWPACPAAACLHVCLSLCRRACQCHYVSDGVPSCPH